MEPESLYNLLQLPGRVDQAAGVTLSQGEKKKFLPPTSRKDPKLEELQKVLTEWINAKLLPEHIVVRSLEEDIFDGLILHHLFLPSAVPFADWLQDSPTSYGFLSPCHGAEKLTGVKLDVEEIALTAASQRRKLAVVLEAASQSLQVEEPQAQWSVESIFNKDLLATLHLLVALAKCFQPDLSLPTNVKVEVIIMESTKSGLKSEMSVEQLTECGCLMDLSAEDVFDELFKLAPEKVNAVKEAIVNFVNQKLDRLGLSVQNLDTQFADGVILLLLIGQLEGFFLHLKEFYLTPKSPAEMLSASVHLMLHRLSPVEKGSARCLPDPRGPCTATSCHGGLWPLARDAAGVLGVGGTCSPCPCPVPSAQDCDLPLSLSDRVLSRGLQALLHASLPDPCRSPDSWNLQGSPGSAFIIPRSGLALWFQSCVHHHTWIHTAAWKGLWKMHCSPCTDEGTKAQAGHVPCLTCDL
ncbi:gamma-parvin isoform X2 [Orcinus orca]|uniref:gamma-parvin isoform X2 n=1 Tax=Orcinus orca TaxID=9733 RepID=UPI002110E90F|nr:gamma-parvin isoform X2 [Orcinus orca]